MLRALIFGTLFAGLLLNSSWAQNKGELQAAGPPSPVASGITFQWDYSCPSGQNCSFICMGTGGASRTSGASGTGGASGTSGASGASGTSGTSGTGGASHVTKLAIYLGAIPVGGNQKAPAVVYEFSTREIPRGNGFIISTGINALPCQVNGLTLDYSGPPRNGRTTFETTSGKR